MTERYTRLPVPGLPGVYFLEHDLTLAGRELRVLAASSLDLLQRAKGDRIPYWCVAWPAGLALARYLAGLPLAGKRVLEVGSGVGISGLGAAVAEARVLVTDNEAPALRLAVMNARRNGLQLHAAAADWRAWPVTGRFDLVCGSDVTYEPAAFPALLEVLAQTVAPGGEVLLTDPGRLYIHGFQTAALQAGWTWESEPLPHEGRQAVFLYRLHRTG